MMDQITAISFANKQEIDAYTILREYIQVKFLDVFFRTVKPKTFFFKGGTALRLLYGSDRFSEDLDFTVSSKTKHPVDQAKQAVAKLKTEIPDISIKEVKTIAGESAKISLHGFSSHHPLTIKLDFSIRENVLTPQVTAIKTMLPIVGISLVDTISKEEILAEKIRAVVNRKKARDIYDLWYLLHTGTVCTKHIIDKKMSYYSEHFKFETVNKAIISWDTKDLIQDLAKFLPKSQRRIIPELPRLTSDLLKQSAARLPS